jgi:hypothetical protein
VKRRYPQNHPLIVFKKSRIHGTGGFARVDIRRGQRIIEYVGPKLTKTEAEAELNRLNPYIFILDEVYDIDGSVDWNPARFLNHSCAPNCEVEIVRGRIWIYALRKIKSGEELTYNYSHDLDDYEARPCRCGASNCVGYMVAEKYFNTLSQRQQPADTSS